MPRSNVWHIVTLSSFRGSMYGMVTISRFRGLGNSIYISFVSNPLLLNVELLGSQRKPVLGNRAKTGVDEFFQEYINM